VNLQHKKELNRLKRKKRIRRHVIGTGIRPRMTIFKSLNHCYVQLIDDEAQKTVVAASTVSKELKGSLSQTGNTEAARKLGQFIAEKALAMNITAVVFDRNGFLYHGRVKALAEGAREKGLQF
jgi:large subunit ribosomal protein L18